MKNKDIKESVNRPKVSIITVVKNDVANIKSTIDSVITQTYSNIEYIIIDGDSVDGTKEIIFEYKDYVNIIVSEPDEGLYYAINKGIRICSGDWIGILNSGDVYNDKHTIETVFLNNKNDVDVIYGDSIEISENKERIVRSGDIKKMEYSPVYRHGSSFVRAEVQRKYEYNTRNKRIGYALDWDMIYKLFKDGGVFCYIDIIIEKYRKEGISNRPLMNAWYNYLVTVAYNNKIKKTFFFVYNIFGILGRILIDMVHILFDWLLFAEE